MAKCLSNKKPETHPNPYKVKGYQEIIMRIKCVTKLEGKRVRACSSKTQIFNKMKNKVNIENNLKRLKISHGNIKILYMLKILSKGKWNKNKSKLNYIP